MKRVPVPTIVVLLALEAVVAWQAAAGWRFFPSLVADQGWYLQVARRLSQGEILYRDVLWSYGPLPAHALAWLFRAWGADAGLATLLNAALAALAVMLSYGVARTILSARAALFVTSFAVLAGPFVGGDLARAYLYAYTQALAWGAVASLAALLCLLRWLPSRRARWLWLGGAAAGLAFLAKPEFGVTAAAASAVIFSHSRASRQAWLLFLAALGVTLGMGFGAQAYLAGWSTVWRGYTGYDQTAARGLWGLQPGVLAPLRWTLGVYSMGAALTAFWLATHAIRGRRLWRLAGLGFGALGASSMLPDLVRGGGQAALSALRNGGWSALSLQPFAALSWGAAVVWGLCAPLLLLAAWSAYRRGAPTAWWGIWAFALTANVRFVLIGSANPFVFAPALAALWLALVEAPAGAFQFWSEASEGRICSGYSDSNRPTGMTSVERPQLAMHPAPTAWRRPQRMRLVWGLAAVGLMNLAAQALLRDSYFNQPRAWLATALGPVAVTQDLAVEIAPLQRAVQAAVAPGAPLLAVGFNPGWYLLTERANPTRADVLMAGLGVTGVEAPAVAADLVAHPPAAVILPAGFWPAQETPLASSRARDLAAVRAGLSTWWATLSVEYAAAPVADVSRWVLLVRR